MTARLPDKVPGEHRWIVLCTYSVTHSEARAIDDGTPVLLGAHNAVTRNVGCIDCEQDWSEAGQRCPAPASPEMESVTGDVGEELPGLDVEDEQRIVAAMDVTARVGAREFKLTCVNPDAPVPLLRWEANAAYEGTPVTSGVQDDIITAVEVLACRVLALCSCVACGRAIVLAGDEDEATVCHWRRFGNRWVAGCLHEAEVANHLAGNP